MSHRHGSKVRAGSPMFRLFGSPTTGSLKTDGRDGRYPPPTMAQAPQKNTSHRAPAQTISSSQCPSQSTFLMRPTCGKRRTTLERASATIIYLHPQIPGGLLLVPRLIRAAHIRTLRYFPVSVSPAPRITRPVRDQRGSHHSSPSKIRLFPNGHLGPNPQLTSTLRRGAF